MLGIGVVINAFVIFVRTDDIAHVILAVGLACRPAGPEARRLKHDFGPGIQQEGAIFGRLPVLPDRVGDIGADVLLVGAAADRDDLPVRPDRIRRRRLIPRVGRLPGVERAAVA
jgi:hypothetical protein